jgi:phosphatidylethanolamine/phosphatidyl-N-methylethanolamine N-methyltransferase
MSPLTFVREFIRSPGSVGAIWPSGRELAELMVESADIRPGHVVAEVGAGTGPFTRALRDLRPDNRLISLEPNAELAAALRANVPGVEVEEAFAQSLPALAAARGLPHFDRIVSGLPLTLWDDPILEGIFTAFVDALPADGRMVTFSYVVAQWTPRSAKMRRHLERYFGSVRKSRIAWANLPPALVFICEQPRRPDARQLS